VLVEQHLGRLAEDGRSPVTLSTYRFAAAKLAKFLGGVRVGEATPARIDAAIRSMRTAHGPTMARQSKTILRGALQLAVMANVLGANPVRDVQPIGLKQRPKGATALSADQLRELLAKLRADNYCKQNDLVDPITVLIATGLRRSELLGLRWTDFDETRGTMTVAGKIVREHGRGLVRIDETKTAAGRRALPLPRLALDVLRERALTRTLAS
jgi:integrase